MDKCAQSKYLEPVFPSVSTSSDVQLGIDAGECNECAVTKCELREIEGWCHALQHFCSLGSLQGNQAPIVHNLHFYSIGEVGIKPGKISVPSPSIGDDIEMFVVMFGDNAIVDDSTGLVQEHGKCGRERSQGGKRGWCQSF